MKNINYDNFDLQDIVQKRNDVIDLKHNLQNYVQRLRKHENNLAIKEMGALKGGHKDNLQHNTKDNDAKNEKSKQDNFLFSIISDIITNLMIPALSSIGFTPNFQELKNTITMVEDYINKIEILKKRLKIEEDGLNKIIFLIKLLQDFSKNLTENVPDNEINKQFEKMIENENQGGSTDFNYEVSVIEQKIKEKIVGAGFDLQQIILFVPVFGNIKQFFNMSRSISLSFLDLQRDLNKVLLENGKYFNESFKRLIELIEKTPTINEKIKDEISRILGKVGKIKILNSLTHNSDTEIYKNIINFFNEHFRKASSKISLADIDGNKEEKPVKALILRMLLTILITLTLFPKTFYEKLPQKIKEPLLKIQMSLKSNIIKIPFLPIGEESIVKFHWGLFVKVIEKIYLKKIPSDMVDWFNKNDLVQKEPIELFSFFIKQVVPDMTLVDIIFTALKKLVDERKKLTLLSRFGGKKSKKKSSRKRIKGKKKGKYTRKR